MTQVTKEILAAMTDEEILTASKQIESSSDYYGKWRVRGELKRRNKLATAKKACNKACDKCTVKLLCTLSSPDGNVLARDKVDMKLSYTDMQFDNKPFNIPAVRGAFSFYSLDRESYMSSKVNLWYRLMPTQTNEKTGKLERVPIKDLPKKQITYDRYHHYYLEYDNLFTQVANGDYNRDKLDKMQCPILLEETFNKSINSIKNHRHDKRSVRWSCEEDSDTTKAILKELKETFYEEYKILTLHQMKTYNLYTPIVIEQLQLPKKTIKSLERYRTEHNLLPYPSIVTL